MLAAVVHDLKSAPRYGEFPEPVAQEGEQIVRVRAAALSNLVKARASGKHYSSAAELPLVPGYDGVGTLADGRRVYFFGPRAPFGSMAQLCPAKQLVELPQGLDDATGAALGNPGMASWGALLGRARMQPGQTVLVNGATGVAGQQAVQAARHLLAGRIVVTGRNRAVLDSLGADEAIWLEQPDEALLAAFRQLDVDIVLDYLWGHSAQLLLQALAGKTSRTRFVQIGSSSGATLSLEAHQLRSSGLELVGSGLGSLSEDEIAGALRQMFDAAADLRIEVETVDLSEVERAWGATESGRRLVFRVPA